MYCSNYGKEIPPQSRFCKWCGAAIIQAQTQQETQDIPTGNSAQTESGKDVVMDYLEGSIKVAAELLPPSRLKAFACTMRNVIFVFLIVFVILMLASFGLSYDLVSLMTLIGVLVVILTGIISYVVYYRRAKQKYEEERRWVGKH